MTDTPSLAPPWLDRRIAPDLWMQPPGWSEADGMIDRLPSRRLFDPAVHDPPDSLADLDRVFDVFDDKSVVDRVIDSHPFPPLRPDGPIDLLAWCVTFRRGAPWGIYIRERGIEAISSAITSPEVPLHLRRKYAAVTLYLHEYSHFLFDVAARSMEGIVGADLYVPRQLELARRGDAWDHLIEALCNAFAYRSLRAPGAKRDIKAFLRRAPAGYRDFGSYLGDNQFTAGIERVHSELLHGSVEQAAGGTRSLYRDHANIEVGPWLVPVYIVGEPGAPAVLALITALAQVDESPAFQRSLRKLPRQVQDAWSNEVVPALLSDTRTAGQFKRLTASDAYSVRVAGRYRAILRKTNDGRWRADEISHRAKAYRS